MLRFLIAGSAGTGPLPTPLVDLLGAEEVGPQPPSVERIHWSSTSAGLQLGGWWDGSGPRPWTTTPAGLVAHAGEALDVSPSDRGPEALMGAVAEEGLPAVLPSLEGVYVLAHLTSEGRADLAGDPLGLHTIYTATIPGAVLVGNDLNLVAAGIEAGTGRPPEPDLGGLAMVVVIGYPLGERTTYQGVNAVPSGHGVSVEVDGTLQVPRRWPEPWDVEHSPTLRDEDLDAVAARMVGLMQAAVSRYPDAPLCELTSGRDSRTVLAVARLAGLVDQLTFYTRGGEGSPDFVGARAVAERHGLSFVRAAWPIPPAGWRSHYQAHVRRVAGQAGTWYSSEARHHPGATFSGLMGETLRHSSGLLAGIRNRRMAARRFRQLLSSKAGPLRPEVFDATVEELTPVFTAPLDAGCDPSDLGDAFYATQQEHRLLGVAMDRNLGFFYPLYAQGASPLAFALGPSARRDEAIRKGLFRRAGLPEDEVAFTKSDRRARAPMGPAGTDPHRPGGRRHPLIDLTTGQPGHLVAPPRPFRGDAVRQLVAERPDSPAYQIVDRAAFLALVDRYEDLSYDERIKLHKALTPLLWLPPAVTSG